MNVKDLIIYKTIQTKIRGEKKTKSFCDYNINFWDQINILIIIEL